MIIYRYLIVSSAKVCQGSAIANFPFCQFHVSSVRVDGKESLKEVRKNETWRLNKFDTISTQKTKVWLSLIFVRKKNRIKAIVQTVLA